jgi:ferredoxin
MRIRVDPELCTGHARCEAEGPDVFVLDELGYNTTSLDDVPRELRDQARRGALACPEQAITIEDDDEPDDEPVAGSVEQEEG